MPRSRPIFPVAVSLQHAATALKIPARKIREAVAMGDLYAYKDPDGTRIRILVSDLENWLRSTWTRATIRRKISRS